MTASGSAPTAWLRSSAEDLPGAVRQAEDTATDHRGQAWRGVRTWFRGIDTPQALRTEEISLDDLGTLIAEPAKASAAGKDAHELWSPARYRGNRRLRDNVEAVCAIVLDDDVAHLDYEAEQADLAALGMCALVHSTWSTDDERPTYRVILPLARSVTADEYDRLHALVRARLAALHHPIPTGAIDPSRAWYEPVDRQEPGRTYRSAVVVGEILDPDAAMSTAEAAWQAHRERHARSEQREQTARSASGRPGDEWAAVTGWAAVLEPHGWRQSGQRGEVTYWCRPGKRRGVSATTGYGNTDTLYVFSDGAPPFEAAHAYSKFGAYALLEHGGDFGRAARALAERGYGARRDNADGSDAGAAPEQHDDYRRRFFDDAPSIDAMLSTAPPPRRYVVRGLIPRRVGGLIVGPGGVGKSYIEILLGASIACGWDFGPYRTVRGKVLIVSREEDRDELHRRLHNVVRMIDPQMGAGTPWRRELAANLALVDLVGVRGAALDDAMIDLISEKAQSMGGVSLVVLDPLGRLLEDGARETNETGVAGAILDRVNELVTRTDATVLIAHHTNKAGRIERTGEDTQTNATSGSHLLDDLSRLVIRLGHATPSDITTYGLEGNCTYAKLWVGKGNHVPIGDPPMFLRRERNYEGALRYVRVRRRDDVLDDRMLALLIDARRALTRDEWVRECAEATPKIGRDSADAARKRLVAAGRVRANTAERRTEPTRYEALNGTV